MGTLAIGEAKINCIPVTAVEGMRASAENTGRWTLEEHSLFLKGLEFYGKGWKKIAELIKTRTVVQVRTHAQKYFLKQVKDNPSISRPSISTVKISGKFRGSTIPAVQKKSTKLLGRCRRKKGGRRKSNGCKTGKRGIPLSAGNVNKVPCLPGELSPNVLPDDESYNYPLHSPQELFQTHALSTQELKDGGSYYPCRSSFAQLRHYNFNTTGPEKDSPTMPVSDIHVPSPGLPLVSLRPDPEGKRSCGMTRENPVPCTFDWTTATCDELPNSVNPTNNIGSSNFMHHSKSLAPSYSTSECTLLDEISIPFDVSEESLSSSDCGTRSYNSLTDTEGSVQTPLNDALYLPELPFFLDHAMDIPSMMNSPIVGTSPQHDDGSISNHDFDILEDDFASLFSSKMFEKL